MREFLWVKSGPYFSAYEKSQSARSLKSAEVEDAGRDGWKWRVLRPGHRRATCVWLMAGFGNQQASCYYA